MILCGLHNVKMQLLTNCTVSREIWLWLLDHIGEDPKMAAVWVNLERIKRKFSSIQFSPMTDQVGFGFFFWGGHKRLFIRDPLPVLSAGGPCERLWHGKGCPLYDVVHPAFPLLTMVSPTLQGALKDGLERLSSHVTCLILTVARTMWYVWSWQLPEQVSVDP